MWWDRVLRPEILALVLIFGLPVIAVICGSAVAVLKHRSDNELKLDASLRSWGWRKRLGG